MKLRATQYVIHSKKLFRFMDDLEQSSKNCSNYMYNDNWLTDRTFMTNIRNADRENLIITF